MERFTASLELKTVDMHTKTQPTKDEADRAARRAQAQAELRAAQLEEERERAERELGRARLAEFSARWDQIEAEQRRWEQDEWNRQYERQQEATRQLEALASMDIPTATTMDDCRAFWAGEDREAERRELARRDEQRAYIDQCESRRLWDWPFRARYDRHHPGGAQGCTCDDHRVWRREPPR